MTGAVLPPAAGAGRERGGVGKICLMKMLPSQRRWFRERGARGATAAGRVWRGLAAGGLVLLAAMPAARAQTPSPLAEWQYNGGEMLRSTFMPEIPRWQVVAGGAMAVQPLYDGSARTHVEPGLSFDMRYRDIAFASLGEGIGINLIHEQMYRAGVAISYDLGRQESADRVHLNGLGNVNFAPEAKVFGDVVLSKDFPVVLRANVRRQIGATNGWIGDLGAYMPLPGSGQTFQWFAGPSATLADSAYMQRYFGVGVAQSRRSGLRRFNASAGFKSVGFGLSANYFFTHHWFVNGEVAVTRLVSSAARSPITQSKTGVSAGLSMNYMF
jgi:outer membrane scaffolding protein for murein synthesis (MipA/OmpV family)